MCSETSPRVSFSNDLGQEHGLQIDHMSRRDTTLLGSNSDFEFSICSSLDHESSLADELFADGMILPVQMQERNISPKQIHRYEPPPKASLPPLPCPSTIDNSKKESMREIMVMNSELEEKPQSKSFWGFKRSSSLNCDIKKSLICSLPILSRSNSTGSAPNPKRTTMKDVHKHNSQKQQSNSTAKSSSSSSAATFVYSLPQKRPLKKNYSGSHGNGVRISPVLNVPSPYISKGTANLFGLGSFLRNGKEKKNRK